MNLYAIAHKARAEFLIKENCAKNVGRMWAEVIPLSTDPPHI